MSAAGIALANSSRRWPEHHASLANSFWIRSLAHEHSQDFHAPLVGTTNDELYLRALSGENRRFLPVKVGRIDFKALIRDRDQLWAEASAEEPLEPSLALPEDLWQHASEARASRTQSDPWADILINIAESAAFTQATQASGKQNDDEIDMGPVYETGTDRDGNPEHRVSSVYVIGVALAIPPDRRTTEHGKRAGLVMKSLGWTYKKTRINGRSVWGFVRPIDPFDYGHSPSEFAEPAD